MGKSNTDELTHPLMYEIGGLRALMLGSTINLTMPGLNVLVLLAVTTVKVYKDGDVVITGQVQRFITTNRCT